MLITKPQIEIKIREKNKNLFYILNYRRKKKE